jgi:hypothetical protein
VATERDHGKVANDLHASDAPFDGRWWAPGEAEHVVGGRLALADGIWRLTLMGWLGPWDHRELVHPRPPVVCGEIGTTPVTLIDMVGGGLQWSNGNPPHRAELSVNQIVVGAHTDGTSKFTQAAVRVLNLNEWARRSVFSVASEGSDNVGPGESRFRDTFVYTDPGVLTAKLPHATMSLVRGQGQSLNDLSHLNVTSDEWALFDFDQPLSLGDIGHDYLRPLASLFRLATCESCPILRLEVLPEGADEKSGRWTLLAWEPRGPVAPPGRWFQFIFTLPSVEFATVVARWWELQPQVGLATDLLDTLDGTTPTSNRFLNAASAIEAYHRALSGQTRPSDEHRQRLQRIKQGLSEVDRAWLSQQLAHSHEPTFAERIQAVADRAGPLFPPVVGNTAEWIKWVKQARNSVAHRDPDMIDIEQEWRTTIRVTATIDWLMRLTLLRELGIADDVVEEGVRQQRGLEAAKDFLRQEKPEWFTATSA